MIAAAVHLIVCMVVFSMVERLWPSPAAHKWWRRPLVLDICSWLILPLAVGAGITLAVLSTDAVLPRQYLWPWFETPSDAFPCSSKSCSHLSPRIFSPIGSIAPITGFPSSGVFT